MATVMACALFGALIYSIVFFPAVLSLLLPPPKQDLTFTPDRERLAHYGVALEDALRALEAARVGAKVGVIYDGARRSEVRLLMPPEEASRQGIGDLFVETHGGELQLARRGGLHRTCGYRRAERRDHDHRCHQGTGARTRSRYRFGAQRPLATVVIFGIVVATFLMLLVFPGILKIALPQTAGDQSANNASRIS